MKTLAQSSAHELAEAIARNEAAPHAGDVDQRARFPVEAFASIKARGLLAMMVPATLGGGGLSIGIGLDSGYGYGGGYGGDCYYVRRNVLVPGTGLVSRRQLVCN